MSDLKEQAGELGIKVDGRWSDARIREEIDLVLAQEQENTQNDDTEQESSQEEETETTEQNDSEILAQEAEKDNESYSVQNISGRPWALSRTILQPDATYTLTERDLADKKFMKRLERAVSMKMLAPC